VQLGREKDYRLVGVQSLGFNAFFVHAGVGEELLPELSPEECFTRIERLRAWGPAWLDAMFRGGHEWQEV
jgi:hypothetical protein